MAQNSVYQTYSNNQSALQFQFSNIALSLSSAPGTYFPFIVSISYSDTNDVSEGRGISPYPMGTTLGEYKASGSIEVQKLYNEQWIALIAAQSPSGNSIYDAVWDLNVQYQLRVPPGQPQPAVVTDTLHGCRLTGGSMDLSQGNGVLVTKYSLYVAYITWNGRLPLDGLPQ